MEPSKMAKNAMMETRGMETAAIVYASMNRSSIVETNELILAKNVMMVTARQGMAVTSDVALKALPAEIVSDRQAEARPSLKNAMTETQMMAMAAAAPAVASNKPMMTGMTRSQHRRSNSLPNRPKLCLVAVMSTSGRSK